MALSLTYTGNPKYTEIAEATQQANAFLQDGALFTLISGHEGSFDDSVPNSLTPAQVAGYFRDENFALTVIDYRDPKRRKSIGGRFQSSMPTVLQINVLALPRRRACEFAAVLVHEGTHALSHRIENSSEHKISFTHVPNARKGNEDTAPYWLQSQAQASLCGGASFLTEEPLEVEIEEGGIK